MFWVFTAASAIGYSFFKLGAVSVWNSVLTLVIQLLVIALLVAMGYILWQRLKKRQSMQ